MNHIRRLIRGTSVMMLLSALIISIANSYLSVDVHAAKDDLVFVIPLENEVEQGLAQFLSRAVQEAEEASADAILLDINTPGGDAQAAMEIGDLIRSTKIPVTAYIRNDAFSAGTYIALNADQIVMGPGSAMGAATPIDLRGNMAEQKFVSAWMKKMASAAEMNGRNPDIARAMVDPDMEIEGLTVAGEVLSLSANEALENGYAEHIAGSREEVLEFMNFTDATIEEMQLTAGEKLARWVTNPFVVPLLLTLGLVGLAVELLIPGFGIAGFIGISAFVLYFFGHFFVGYANWLHILLFITGIVLMLIELFAPGFGVFGGLGIATLIISVIMSAYDTTMGLMSLGIALVITILFIVIMVKYFGHRGVWHRFILKDELKRESGYVASEEKEELVGKKGTTMTDLRPAGIAEIEGARVDVVSEGGYIRSGKTVVVVKVDGTRVVVREPKENN